jgi:hypothetical protein
MVFQQLRFHFDILRFYQDFTFLIFAVWFFIMGNAFYWYGGSHSRPLIPLCCFLMVLLPSRLGSKSVRKLASAGLSQIVMVHFHNLSNNGGPLLLIQPEATFFIFCLEKTNLPGGETSLPFK